MLFRLCDLVVDGDTSGALVFLEELSEQGQDLGRLVTDLLEHLRQLMLVQHMGEVPDTLPVTEEARERLREQANQLGAPTVLRLIDLLAVAVEDMRQGGDPRLPLELALVKVTRPGSDLSREALAYRLELLERGGGHGACRAGEDERRLLRRPLRRPRRPRPTSRSPGARGSCALRASFPASGREARRAPGGLAPIGAARGRGASIPAGAMLAEARPSALEGDMLILEFPEGARFHRQKAEEPKSVAILQDALYEITGRRLELRFETGERPPAGAAPSARPSR